MQAVGVLIAISLHMHSVVTAPVLKEKTQESSMVETYNSFRDPINKLICSTRKTKEIFVRERNVKGKDDETSYDKAFKNECIKKFGKDASKSLGIEQRFVFAMKLFQKLVGLAQDMQISESRINDGIETQFVRDFREIEYQIRELVEDKMRAASVEIVQDLKIRKDIPEYSVGGLIDETLTNPKKEKSYAVNAKNSNKMKQIESCLYTFHANIIIPEGGKDASFEC